MDFRRSLRLSKELCKKYEHAFLSRFKWSNSKEEKSLEDVPETRSSILDKNSSPEEDSSFYNYKWKPEISWLSKALEPALQLYKWVLPTGSGVSTKLPPTDRSIAEIFSSIQRSKLGFQDWTLSDLTIGLYLLYLRQASESAVDHVKGEVITSESIVHELIYHLELARGSYRDNAAGVARSSMLRVNDVVKFTGRSSVLRPGYYIGIDRRKKLIILCIRGTQNVYDIITDIVSSGHEDVTFEGYSTHFGTAEAARWFLTYEIDTIRKYLDEHQGFRLRLVGHSLGGAIASLLAVMLRRKSSRELGFSPDTVTAITYGTPPCVSKELAENCSDFVTSVVMQGDIIPRLSAASVTRLRNEIVETDWVSVFTREDWKGILELVSNAKQVVSSIQDISRKLAAYTKFRGQSKLCDEARDQEISWTGDQGKIIKKVDDDLFVPGTVYYLRRCIDNKHSETLEYFTLLKSHPGEHTPRILLSSNLISDHKCESHYLALRDVIKGLPVSE